MGFQGINENDNPYEQKVIYRRGVNDGYTWALMNPAAGVYDWSKIDSDLAMVQAAGQQLAFRVYTMRGEQYGGHTVPQWVIDAGAIILSGVEPDYRSRVYQQKWALFVDALRARYDGNPLIAFIDIAGYGEFNQWFSSSTAPYWQYQQSVPDPWNPNTLDGSARKHLVAMYAGGSATCLALESDGTTQTSFGYSYPGFQSTQLLMPYNGLFDPTQMVLDHYPTVGLRNDVLGSQQLSSFVTMGHGATTVSQRAPVVFETGAGPRDYAKVNDVLAGMGGTILEDRNNFHSDPEFPAALEPVGYRYTCDSVQVPTEHHRGRPLPVVSRWRNIGLSRAYPRMGQTFALEWAFEQAGTVVATARTGEAPSGWRPQERQYCESAVPVADVPPGTYRLLAGIVDLRTGGLLNLGSQTGAVRQDRRLPIADILLS